MLRDTLHFVNILSFGQILDDVEFSTYLLIHKIRYAVNSLFEIGNVLGY